MGHGDLRVHRMIDGDKYQSSSIWKRKPDAKRNAAKVRARYGEKVRIIKEKEGYRLWIRLRK